MAMRSRALNLDCRGGRDEGLPFQNPTQGVDLGWGPMREVGEGSFNDAPVEARGLAEKDGRWGVAVGDRFHVHGVLIPRSAVISKHNNDYYMGTKQAIHGYRPGV